MIPIVRKLTIERVAAVEKQPGSSPEVKPANRRRHRRVRPAAVAALERDQKSLSVWTVKDLSVGGASLMGDGTLSPGEHVQLTLHMPNRPPLPVCARVLRRQLANHGRTAICFEKLGPSQNSSLDEAVAAANEAHAAAAITDLIVGRGSPASALLERELSAVGRLVRRVESPVDAAAWLELATGVTTVIIEEDLMVFHGWKLLPHVREMRPAVRRLVLGNPIQSFRLNMALRSGLVEGVLEQGAAGFDLLCRAGAPG